MKRVVLSLLSILLLSQISFAQNWRNEISSNYFYIRVAENPEKYWDLPGNHPNTAKRDIQFQIWDKDADEFERTFIFPTINGTELFAIRNKAGYIVDVAGKEKLSATEEIKKKTGKKFKMKKDNGVEIQTWDYDGTGVARWQQWRLIIVDQNVVIFENAFTNKAIDIQMGHIHENGSKLQSWDRNNSGAQRFVLEYATGPKKGQLLRFD
ncbi:MAG: RICIN domain-containing protein [Sphingobacteriia bacterium]|nr:RICIN domain-containing protein [Sphingobacteriia bacterium]